MPIYKLEDNRIVELEKTTFTIERIDERNDLQKYILNSIDIIEKDLFIIDNEFNNWEDSRRSIDILGLDKDANLVVIELKKTENGGHMELQSIRYAAMISNMTFLKAVNAHKKYLIKCNDNPESAEKRILNFLEWSEAKEEEFAQDVRIILVSADFSKEIMTSVLWLNDRDLDIKCIRIKPQKDDGKLYFDIQQIVPLKESEDYQIKIKEKKAEERQSRNENSKRDYSKYDIKINGDERKYMNKRKAIYYVISKAIESGIKPNELFEITNESRWIWVEKECANSFEFEQEKKNRKKYDASRWFVKDDELFVVDGKTYAYSNQQTKEVYKIINEIFNRFPQLNGSIEISQ